MTVLWLAVSSTTRSRSRSSTITSASAKGRTRSSTPRRRGRQEGIPGNLRFCVIPSHSSLSARYTASREGSPFGLGTSHRAREGPGQPHRTTPSFSTTTTKVGVDEEDDYERERGGGLTAETQRTRRGKFQGTHSASAAVELQPKRSSAPIARGLVPRSIYTGPRPSSTRPWPRASAGWDGASRTRRVPAGSIAHGRRS